MKKCEQKQSDSGRSLQTLVSRSDWIELATVAGGKPAVRWYRDGATGIVEGDVQDREDRERMAGELGKHLPWTLDVIHRELLALAGDAAADGADSADSVSDSNEPAKRSQSQELVEMCIDRYSLHCDKSGEAFAIRKGGPNVAIMLRGLKDALKNELSSAYWDLHGRSPSTSAMSDAMATIAGRAANSDRQPVHLRYAAHNGGVVIDLGDSKGRVVEVKPGSWEVVETSPVTFRRTALTAELAEPKRPGNVELLRELANLDDTNWRLVVCWLVAAMICWIARPILLLGGEQGTGKTTLIKMLLGVVDRSSAQVMSQPKNLDDWAVVASGTATIAVDNISKISGWWSDLLCQAVTGQGVVKRKLYADSDLTVLSFRRAIALTSIDPGALRGDLADRLLKVDLMPISDQQRLSEADLWRRYDEIAGQVFAGLLDLLAAVLERLSTVQLDKLPRMADFAKVVAAADPTLLQEYLDQRTRLAAEVLDENPVAGMIMDLLVSHGGRWCGTCKALREALLAIAATEFERTGTRGQEKDIPKSPQAMRGALSRLASDLRKIGIDIKVGERSSGRKRDRLVTLIDMRGNKPSTSSEPSEMPKNKAQECGRSADSVDDRDLNRPTVLIVKTGPADDVDDVDGWKPLSSAPVEVAGGSGNVGQSWGDV